MKYQTSNPYIQGKFSLPMTSFWRTTGCATGVGGNYLGAQKVKYILFYFTYYYRGTRHVPKDYVLVSYCFCNKLSQIQWLKQHKCLPYGSASQNSDMDLTHLNQSVGRATFLMEINLFPGVLSHLCFRQGGRRNNVSPSPPPKCPMPNPFSSEPVNIVPYMIKGILQVWLRNLRW